MVKHKENKSEEERMFNLYKKFINYKYKGGQNKPQSLVEIEGIAIKGSRKKIEGTYKEGWVTIGHIEEKSCPYLYPDKKRYKFLKSPMIVSSKLKYRTKNKQKRSKTLYRLKRDATTSSKLFKVFYEKGFIEEFMDSDYFEDTFYVWHDKFLLNFEAYRFNQLLGEKWHIDSFNKKLLSPTYILFLIKNHWVLPYLKGVYPKEVLLACLIYDSIATNDLDRRKQFNKTILFLKNNKEVSKK